MQVKNKIKYIVVKNKIKYMEIKKNRIKYMQIKDEIHIDKEQDKIYVH